MTRVSSQCKYMSLDDFEELSAEKPADEKWERIGGSNVALALGEAASGRPPPDHGPRKGYGGCVGPLRRRAGSLAREVWGLRRPFLTPP
jgi:hypothetical protein